MCRLTVEEERPNAPSVSVRKHKFWIGGIQMNGKVKQFLQQFALFS
jgi:hypothetical protein